MRRLCRAGFTLIELLIVVVIIGILAAIVVPKFANTKEKAYLASMKADLRNFATAQEAYFYDHSVYYAGPIPAAEINFTPTRVITIAIASADGMGWSATATHSSTPRTCALFFGSAAPVAPATVEGEPGCS